MDHMVEAMKIRMTKTRRASTGIAGALFLAASLAVLPAIPAAAQDSNLARQVERLRRDLNDLQRHVYRGTPSGTATADSGVTARLTLQVTQMQDQMRAMNGRVEEIEHRIRVLEQRLDRMAEDLELRLQSIEDKIAAGGPVRGPGGDTAVTPRANDAATAALAAMPKDGTARQQYDYAFEFLKDRDFGTAAVTLQAFLDRNPSDPLASNALYWLGETHYLQKDYREAAKVFLDGYKRFPQGAKAPDSLLKLGMSLAALEEDDSACKTFAKLRSSFPKAPSRILRAAESEQKKLKCR